MNIDWDGFKKYCITRIPMKQTTFKLRCRYLRHLIKNTDNIDNPDDVYTYFNKRLGSGSRGDQLNCYIKALNVYYKYKNISHRFKLFREYEKPLKIPNREDITLLLSNCNRSRKGKTTKTMIFLFCHTGLRNDELCSLKFDNIDWVHNEIRLIGKWDRPRVIPVKPYVLHGRYCPSLCNYINHHRWKTDKKIIFTSTNGGITPKVVRGYVKDVARRSGIPWVHPHAFRHYYATTLLSRGVNIKVVQKLLGHGNVKETSRYLHARELDIRRAIEKVGFDDLLKGSGLGVFGDFDFTNSIGGI